MDPITLGTLMLAWFLHGAWQAFIAQAGAEGRRAREVIVNHVHEHRVRLDRKLSDARRNGSPSSGWWWAAAAVASWRALRRGMRGTRPGATALSSKSPLRRLWDALIAGGRQRVQQGRKAYVRRPLRDRARRAWQRRPHVGNWRLRWNLRGGSKPGPAMGVCDDCGALCARTALRPAPSPSGGTWLVCAACRARYGQPPPPPPPPTPPPVTPPPPLDGGYQVTADLVDPDPADPDPEPVLAPRPEPVTVREPLDLVGEDPVAPAALTCPVHGTIDGSAFRPDCTGCIQAIADARHERIAGEEVRPSLTPPVWPKPAGWDDDPPPVSAPSNGQPAPQITDGGTSPAPPPPSNRTNGGSMANGSGSGGGLAVRNGGGSPAKGSGEAYTHGAWQQAYQLMTDCLAALPKALDGVLGDLKAADVGRDQATGMVRAIDATRGWGQMVGQTLATVDPMALPVVDAVTAAGGPTNVNGMAYYQEV